MKWKQSLFTLCILALYIPTVFLGVNLFFDTIENDCRYPIAKINTSNEELTQNEDKYQDCFSTYQDLRNTQNGWKYVIILIVTNLTIVALFITRPKNSIKLGLFFGTVITSFIATLIALNAKSIIGFILMVLFIILIIIQISRFKKN